MITNVQLTGVPVRDQDKAVEFYRDKLGFELLSDVPFGNGLRWIEVAPAGAETKLVLFTPPGLEDRIGTFSQIVFTSDDVQATYEELNARGVVFTEPPTVQPWGGLQAQFVDQDGNSFVLHSRS